MWLPSVQCALKDRFTFLGKEISISFCSKIAKSCLDQDPGLLSSVYCISPIYIHHCKVSYVKGDLSPTLLPWKPEIIRKNETLGFLVVLKTFETRIFKNWSNIL